MMNKIDKLIKQAQVITDNEDMYRKLAYAIGDAIIMLDENGRVVNWNKAAEHMFGYTDKEVSGRKLHELVLPPDMLQKAEDNFLKFKNTGTGRFIDKVTEVHAVRKDRSEFIAEISISVIKFKGNVHTVGIVRDISERRQNQKKLLDAMDAAESANKAKSDFLANISHEIRTPMNGIIGFLDLLERTQLNSQQNDYIREIKSSTDALLDLINDLLDYSKIEANKLELEYIAFNPRKVIEEATSMFSLRAYSKGIEINAFIDHTLPEVIKGDPGKLKQVLVNLISNAVKFTPEGQVTITAKPILQTMEKADIFFCVSDTGIGISEQDRKKLFEPFTQVDASTTREYGGTGLGLSICRKLIEMMSGKISLASELNSGSAFSFQISFDKGQEKNAKQKACLNGLRVLIADQSSMNRRIARNYLEGAGCIVTEAENGSNAIEILRKSALQGEKIKLLLLDQLLDGKGLEVALRIKEDDSIKDTIINLFTPFANPCNKDAVSKRGISGIIMKPVYRAELINTILSSLGVPYITIQNKKIAGKSEIEFDEYQKKNMRILLVEDNITNQKLAASVLNIAGLSYDVSNNGYEAIAAFRQRHYDLILMDCQMPEMDGYEATKLIRLKEEGRSHITIIAMTANAMTGDIDKCLAAGMDDYISKPFKTDYFLKVIAKWMNSNKTDLSSDVFTEKSVQPQAADNTSAAALSDDSILPEAPVMEETRNNIPAILDKLSSEQHIDRADIYDMYNEYVDLLPQYMDKLRAAINACNFTEISAEAHSLKGSSATLRLNYLSAIASEINRSSKACNIVPCRLNMDKMEVYIRENIGHISHSPFS